MPKLRVIKGPIKGQTFNFIGDTVFIGRSSRNDIQIKDAAISRKQIKIFLIGGKFFVEDLKSTNGTLINGRMIAPGEGFEVGEKDTISMGNTVLQLCEVPRARSLAAVALENKEPRFSPEGDDRLPKDRRSKSSGNLELIYKITELLRQSMTINEFLEKVLQYLFATLPRIDRAAILLCEGEKRRVKEVIAKSRQDQNNKNIHYNKTVVERVIHNGKAVRMSNTLYEPEGALSKDMATSKIRCVLCVPLIVRSQIYGAIYVDSLRGPYGFRRDDLLLLNTLTGSVAVAIENAQLKELRRD
jgi:sigma-B regulation protein RsbU (phosphoserine phosphatase)